MGPTVRLKPDTTDDVLFEFVVVIRQETRSPTDKIPGPRPARIQVFDLTTRVFLPSKLP
jgi:hypothetical protein